ncbi:hypothetical protein BJ912DRAFT_1124061 [Pholiota molesta]|nr:hypothetical protein BJ912DRAFT_1124061 [Pholiota molesta]
MAAPTPCLSFIGIVDFSEKARWLFMTESVTDLLGYEPHELIGRPSLELVHPDEFPSDTIQQDKAAVLVYLRMKHKDPFRGPVILMDCLFDFFSLPASLVCLVKDRGAQCPGGQRFLASPGAKALHNASTAQEITVITPSAANFEFRRWHDPSPMPPSPIPAGMASITIPGPGHARTPPSPSPSTASSSWGAASRSPPATRGSPQSPPQRHRRPRSHSASSRASSRSLSSAPRSRSPSPAPRVPAPAPEQTVITFDPLPSKSFRTAFILDRFSTHCAILYASNDLLLSSSAAIGRSFYDFVEAKDEAVVRSWIGCVKGWGVNEKGSRATAGSGSASSRCVRGEGVCRTHAGPPADPRSRNRHGSHSGRAHAHGSHPTAHGQRPGRYARAGSTSQGAAARRQTLHSPTRGGGEDGEKFDVDAIFSAHSDGLMVILRRAS